MKNNFTLLSFIVFSLLLFLTGCDFISGVFKTGIGVGAFVVIVLVILIFIISRFVKRH